jgi:hypothetical protein
MSAPHGSLHTLLEPLSTCGVSPGCKNESFLICRRCTQGMCVFHLVKCPQCPDYFCTVCLPAHATSHPEPEIRIETIAAAAAFAGGQAREGDLYLRFRPPVMIPGRGHVEVEAHGNTAIVRVVDRQGEIVESWPNAALVRSQDELLVLLKGHPC